MQVLTPWHSLIAPQQRPSFCTSLSVALCVCVCVSRISTGIQYCFAWICMDSGGDSLRAAVGAAAAVGKLQRCNCNALLVMHMHQRLPQLRSQHPANAAAAGDGMVSIPLIRPAMLVHSCSRCRFTREARSLQRAGLVMRISAPATAQKPPSGECSCSRQWHGVKTSHSANILYMYTHSHARPLVPAAPA